MNDTSPEAEIPRQSFYEAFGPLTAAEWNKQEGSKDISVLPDCGLAIAFVRIYMRKEIVCVFRLSLVCGIAATSLRNFHARNSFARARKFMRPSMKNSVLCSLY